MKTIRYVGELYRALIDKGNEFFYQSLYPYIGNTSNEQGMHGIWAEVDVQNGLRGFFFLLLRSGFEGGIIQRIEDFTRYWP